MIIMLKRIRGIRIRTSSLCSFDVYELDSVGLYSIPVNAGLKIRHIDSKRRSPFLQNRASFSKSSKSN